MKQGGDRMNFYEQTSICVSKLSSTEQGLFNYIIKNIHTVKDMIIRDLSAKCFVSTTSIFRLVKKLGYQGYAEFSQALRETEEESRKIHMPSIVSADNYRDSYLKNVIEAVKVITDEKISKFNTIMSRNPNIFIIAEGLSHEVGRYLYRLLTTMGFNVEMPDEEFEFASVLRRVKRDDVLLVLSYTGNNHSVIKKIERIFAIATPTIVSLTRADNNTIPNMSDLNFYVFADEIDCHGADVTSRCGMISIMETLLYKRLSVDSSAIIE